LTPAGLKELAEFKNLHTIRMPKRYNFGSGLVRHEVELTDSDLKALREVGMLHALEEAAAENGKRPRGKAEVVRFSLSDQGNTYPKLTASGLRELAEFPNLKVLYLANTLADDAAVNQLAKFQQLEGLDLGGTKVSDAALPALTRLRNLRWLRLSYTSFTGAAMQKLQMALPACKISR
jgi:hypothetical protein